ncbi:hypothetical protein D9615_008477 [Tricholomella constricta]|uniref:Uncharacterized protein n=1 Tax=Tricholomella constricta TaxID=117010 RepID=A0A8H5M0K7_9AGAR|nr:hypothetical protein D9615_008477 [Tricholomella constricta]
MVFRDKELMDEEEIEDLGDALPEDGRSMTHNLDAYQFEDYLSGVLRLLVGVDMLREQEVYYLPQSGANEVSSRVHVGSVSASPRRNSTTSAISQPTSKAPVSTAGSASTSASAALSARRLNKTASSVMSFSESELTEEEDSPRAKRPRPSPVEAKHTLHTLGDMGPPDSDTRSKKYNTRRSMRLGRDATEYRPGAEGDGDDA